MAETKKTYEIYINQDAGRITNAAGSRVGVALPELYLGNYFIFRCNVVNADLSAFAFPTGAVFFASLNSALGQASADVAASVDADFNVEGQWDSVSLEDGMISFEMNTMSAGLQTFLGTAEKKQVWLELWFKEAGGEFSLICQEKLWINNTGSDFAPVAVDAIEYISVDDFSVADFASLPAEPADGTPRRIKAFNLIATYNSTDGKWYNAIGGEVTAEG